MQRQRVDVVAQGVVIGVRVAVEHERHSNLYYGNVYGGAEGIFLFGKNVRFKVLACKLNYGD